MATVVKECIQQAKFNQCNLEAHRGVGHKFVFDDEEELRSFLAPSEEGKSHCTWRYKAQKKIK